MRGPASADPTMVESLLSTRLFDVERRTYRGPDGRSLVRDIIVHPGAAVVIPILDDGRIVMIHNVRHAAGEELLELPAGTLEADEAPIKTAARELEEETGYVAGRVEPLLSFFSTPGVCTELMHAFIATELSVGEPRMEGGEQVRVEIRGRDSLRRALCDGSIRDGKTLAALGVYFLRNEA